MSLKSNLTQSFPPKASFTEKQLGDLSGKVYIVTGANAGAGEALSIRSIFTHQLDHRLVPGKELARILYSKNASVYLLARSVDKTNQAIASIRKAVPSSRGRLTYLRLDLADLASIKGIVEQFLAKESKIHVLWKNAGVMSSEKDLVLIPQGYEQHVGVNVLGDFLLAKLLTPVLVTTAKLQDLSLCTKAMNHITYHAIPRHMAPHIDAIPWKWQLIHFETGSLPTRCELYGSPRV
jgi:retinol dehydrogenase 12